MLRHLAHVANYLSPTEHVHENIFTFQLQVVFTYESNMLWCSYIFTSFKHRSRTAIQNSFTDKNKLRLHHFRYALYAADISGEDVIVCTPLSLQTFIMCIMRYLGAIKVWLITSQNVGCERSFNFLVSVNEMLRGSAAVLFLFPVHPTQGQSQVSFKAIFQIVSPLLDHLQHRLATSGTAFRTAGVHLNSKDWGIS